MLFRLHVVVSDPSYESVGFGLSLGLGRIVAHPTKMLILLLVVIDTWIPEQILVTRIIWSVLFPGIRNCYLPQTQGCVKRNHCLKTEMLAVLSVDEIHEDEL